ncbi:hypothetical protein DXG01_013843, partial [Tephrocybe rancida]
MKDTFLSLLGIVELKREVIAWLTSTNLPQARKDLLHLALVHSTFTDAALSLLWGDWQNSLGPLLDCLPPDVFCIRNRILDLSPANNFPGAWDRYLYYSQKMEQLILGSKYSLEKQQ